MQNPRKLAVAAAMMAMMSQGIYACAAVDTRPQPVGNINPGGPPEQPNNPTYPPLPGAPTQCTSVSGCGGP